MNAVEIPAVHQVRIHSLTTADLPAVLQIERKVFAVAWRENAFRELLNRDDTDLLVAEADGVLAGYIVCWTVLDQAELGNIAVAPALQGRGVGRALVEAARERIRTRGAREWFLEVREANRAARKLYQSLGFEQVGRRRAYYSQPVEDALVMRLDLPELA